MADMQLPHAGERGHRLDVDVVQGMTGIEAHAGCLDRSPGEGNALELGLNRRAVGIAASFEKRLGIGAGVDFTDPRTNGRGRFDLGKVGIDEHARADPGVSQPGHRRAQPLELADDVEPTLGGHFMAALRHQHRHFGLELTGNRDHLVGRRHLEIELDMREFTKAADILILDVTTVFAQMHRDAVGPAQVSFDRGPDRIGFIGAARLADGSHMVDVDAEFDHGECVSVCAGPSGSAGS